MPTLTVNQTGRWLESSRWFLMQGQMAQTPLSFVLWLTDD